MFNPLHFPSDQHILENFACELSGKNDEVRIDQHFSELDIGTSWHHNGQFVIEIRGQSHSTLEQPGRRFKISCSINNPTELPDAYRRLATKLIQKFPELITDGL